MVNKEGNISKEKYLKKTVSIKEIHDRYIEDHSISLSKFLQKKLDEEIEKDKLKNKKE